MNAIIKVALSFAFCFCLIGGTLIFTGVSSYQTAEQMEADFEPTTLANFVKGDVENEFLFELSEFRPGEQYYALEDPRSDLLRMAYVPLYDQNHPEDDGTGISVVALVSRTAEAEVLASVTVPSLKVQVSENIPAYAYDLGQAYPAINWHNVKVVYVDSEIPTTTSALIYLLIGAGLFLLGIVAAIFACLLKWRTYKAQGNKLSYSEKIEELEKHAAPLNREVNGSKSVETLGKLSGYCMTAVPLLILFNVSLVALRRMDLVNEQVSMGILYFTGPLFLLMSAGGLALRFFVPPIFKIQRVEIEDMPSKIQRKMIPDIEFFMQAGYQMLGFAKTSFMGEKWNAFLISNDRRSVAEVTVEGSKVACSLVSVADSGLLIVIARSESELIIDGTKMGVPLVGKISKAYSQQDLLSILDEFRRVFKSEGTQMLPIAPQNVFHLMHYDAILSGWWAYKSSIRFSKPEPLPTIEETIKTVEGIEEFAFQRWPSFGSAYDEPIATESGSSNTSQSQLMTSSLLDSI